MKAELLVTSAALAIATPAWAQGNPQPVLPPLTAALAPAASPAAQIPETTATQTTATTAADSGQAENTGLADVVVTAQRREENLQRAAISVDVVGGDDLIRNGVTQADALTQLVPALRITQGNGANANFAMRGVSDFNTNAFANPAVLLNLDSVPLVRPTSAHGLFYDLERIEVLKGPQGTLYGRNATGGVINVITHRPDYELGGYINLEAGNYGRRSGQGAINLPLSDKFAIRIAGLVVDRDGYFRDGTSDEVAQAGRLSLRADPTEALSIVIHADYSHDGGRGASATLVTARSAFGRPIDGDVRFVGDPWFSASEPSFNSWYAGQAPRLYRLNSRQDNNYYGVSANINWETSLGTLTVVPGWRKNSLDYVSLVPGFYFAEDQSARQYTVEARFSTDPTKPLSGILGGFYLDDQLDTHYSTENPPATLTNQVVDNTAKSRAIFGALTLRASEQLRFTGSVRYTNERRTTDSTRRDIRGTFDFSVPLVLPDPSLGTLRFTNNGDRVFEATTWRAGAEYDAGERSLLYANVGTGYKTGGFFFGIPTRNSFGPERVTAYTVGSKNRFFDNRVQLNLEAFLIKYRDQQVQRTAQVPGFGNLNVTENAGRSTIKGFELEAEYAPSRNTRFSADIVYLDAKYDSLVYGSAESVTAFQTCPQTTNGPADFTINCSGRSMLQSPKWTANFGVEQRVPMGGGDIVGTVDFRVESGRETNLSYLVETHVDGYTQTNATLGYQWNDRRYSVTAFVQNLENKAVVAYAIAGRNYTIATGGVVAAVLQAPRTFGVRLGARF